MLKLTSRAILLSNSPRVIYQSNLLPSHVEHDGFTPVTCQFVMWFGDIVSQSLGRFIAIFNIFPRHLSWHFGTLNQVYLYSLFPVSTVTNVENNKIQIEKNSGSGHIPLSFLSIPLTFVSYSPFFSVLGADKKLYI